MGRGETKPAGATTRVWARTGKQGRWAGEKTRQVGRGETKPGGRGEQGGQGQRRGFGHALEPLKLKISLTETRNQARWAGEKPSQVGREKPSQVGGGNRGVRGNNGGLGMPPK